jgi:hypothetical protein
LHCFGNQEQIKEEAGRRRGIDSKIAYGGHFKHKTQQQTQETSQDQNGSNHKCQLQQPQPQQLVTNNGNDVTRYHFIVSIIP